MSSTVLLDATPPRAPENDRADAASVRGVILAFGELPIAAGPARADGASPGVFAARAAGLPAVVGDSAELDDVLGTVALRLLISRDDAWGDALSTLATDGALRAPMAAESRGRAGARSWADVRCVRRAAWAEATGG
jgi:hypothetical protein